MKKSILKKLNKKAIATVTVVGVLVVALVASAFGLFKQGKTENYAKQKITKIQKNKELTKAEIDYKNAIQGLNKIEEKYGPIITYQEFRFNLDNYNGYAADYIESEKNKIKPCHELLNDFKNQKNIEIISPFIMTDNFNDEKLKPYLKKCSKYKNWPNKIIDKHTLKEAGKYSYDFRLYDIDIELPDNKSSDIYLFYQGGGVLFKENIQVYDSFILFDVDNCKILHKDTSPPIINYFTRKKTGNIGGVFKYNNNYYTYHYYNKGNISFDKYITRFDKKMPSFSRLYPVTENTCNFHVSN